MAGPSRTWKGVVQSADGGVHCAPKPHILTQHNLASHKSGEATNSESHKTLSANAAPSRRGRRRKAAAGRSDKADLGFPLAQRWDGLTQEHASKEEVAPTGVTVVRIGNAEKGFHPGRRPHPG
jgi:hypothetical protein